MQVVSLSALVQNFTNISNTQGTTINDLRGVGVGNREKKFQRPFSRKKNLEGHSPRKKNSRRGFQGKKIHFENFLRQKNLEGHSPRKKNSERPPSKKNSRRGFRGKKFHFENVLRPPQIINGQPLKCRVVGRVGMDRLLISYKCITSNCNLTTFLTD